MFLYFMALGTVGDDTAVVVAVSSAVAAVSIVSIIVYFAAPQLGRMSEWQNGAYVIGRRLSGIAGDPNEMGEAAALGLLLTAIKWSDFKQRLGLLLSVTFCLSFVTALIMSGSRTSLASVVVILGMKRVMRTRYLPSVVLLVIAGVVCVLLLVPYSEQVMILLARSGEAAEIETGTARTQIWDTVIKLAETNFWSGWGYGSSVFVLPNYAAYMGEAPPHAHNIVLQVWFTTGMIGLVLFLIAFSAQALESALRRDTLAVSLLAFVIFNGLMEAGAFAGIASIPTVALAMAVARQRGRALHPRLAHAVRAVPVG
jgi:O-antigen ligase